MKIMTQSVAVKTKVLPGWEDQDDWEQLHGEKNQFKAFVNLNLIGLTLIDLNLIGLNIIDLNLMGLNIIDPNLIGLNLIGLNIIDPNLIDQNICLNRWQQV